MEKKNVANAAWAECLGSSYVQRAIDFPSECRAKDSIARAIRTHRRKRASKNSTRNFRILKSNHCEIELW